MNQPSLTQDAVPCPGCGYDLRAQADPACPECGQRFPSLDALREASQQASRIFLRVLRWRQRIAGGMIAGILVGWFGGLLINADDDIGVALLGSGIVLALLSSLASLVLLARVLRWRWNPLLSLQQRRELSGSIVVLALFGVPAALAAVGLALPVVVE